jgi:glycerol uptake facilitator-like aquaporin
MRHDLGMNIRKVSAEALGTSILLMSIVGSGQMATSLTKDVGLQLLIGAVVASLALLLLITSLGGISGAHFNPVVTLAALAHKAISVVDAISYIAAQIFGGIVGVALANLMFNQPALFAAQTEHAGNNLLLSEVIATAGLVFLIFTAIAQKKENSIPLLVSAWIGSAYFFTSSSTFANPAVTIARTFTDTFAGIAVASVPGFIVAQLIGAVLGVLLSKFISKK